MIENYQPPNQMSWQGRLDLPPHSSFFQTIQLLNLEGPISTPDQLAFALIGFCCDEGIVRNFGRRGAKEGPNAIRLAFAKLPLHRTNVVCYDAGDILCEDGDLERAQSALGDAVNLLLREKIIPIVLGGGHECAFGNYQGIVKHCPLDALSIINFDAHFDMRELIEENKGTSGTPFLQIANTFEKLGKPFHYYVFGIQKTGNIQALFDVAKHYQVKVVFADELQLAGPHQYDEFNHFIDRIIAEQKHLYLSICLDVFTAPYAPGVSAPQPLGLTPWHVIPLIRRIAQSGKAVSYDIAELSPPHDIDGRTAKLAASLIYEIIHHHLLDVRGV
jgi:formiminoglutamase